MGSIPSGVGTHMQISPSTATTQAGSRARVPQQAKPAHLNREKPPRAAAKTQRSQINQIFKIFYIMQFLFNFTF